MDSASARIEAYYDRLASRYDSSIAFCERMLLEDGRHWAASRACGDTLEIGIGTGRNLAYYPRDVRLVGVDISKEMLSLAHARARRRLGSTWNCAAPAPTTSTLLTLRLIA